MRLAKGAFFPVKSNPTDAVYWTLDPNVCRNCKVRIFANCNSGRLPDGDRRLRLMLAADTSEMAPSTRGVAIALARELGVRLDIVAVGAEVEVAERLKLVQTEAAASEVTCNQQFARAATLLQKSALPSSPQTPRYWSLGDARDTGVNEIGPVAQQIIAASPCPRLCRCTGQQTLVAARAGCLRRQRCSRPALQNWLPSWQSRANFQLPSSPSPTVQAVTVQNRGCRSTGDCRANERSDRRTDGRQRGHCRRHSQSDARYRRRHHRALPPYAWRPEPKTAGAASGTP